MKHTLFMNLIVAPVLLLFVGATIYFGLFFNGSLITRIPDGIYKQIDDEASQPQTSSKPQKTPATSTTPKTRTSPPKKSSPSTPKPSAPPITPSRPVAPSTPPSPKSLPLPKTNSSYASATTDLTSELKAIGRYSTPGLSLAYSKNIATECGWAKADGCYKPYLDKLWVNNDYKKNVSLRRNILAHEYMHYIWQHTDVGTANLRTTLTNKYKTSRELKLVIDAHYVVNGTVDPNEILAYSCTSLNKKQMGTTIYNVCARYLNLSTLSVFVNVKPDRIVTNINSIRHKNKRSALAYLQSLNTGAASGVNKIINGDSIDALKNDPNITTAVQTACYMKRYYINYMYSNSSDEAYLAQKLVDGSRDYFLANGISNIGVAVKKASYIKPGASPILNNTVPLLNMNILVAISC